MKKVLKTPDRRFAMSKRLLGVSAHSNNVDNLRGGSAPCRHRRGGYDSSVCGLADNWEVQQPCRS
ncbi:hypothetical protein KFK09_012852 [Dendrobium nobile]|uniref:Uncharacterized protein n=1 Tax=Dendrobium nobile TaxID=94219 RepID=A0A8T3BIK3_DENNO|nr:hypothetical protein KFK09_012852 [Dendrobium nobile]